MADCVRNWLESVAAYDGDGSVLGRKTRKRARDITDDNTKNEYQPMMAQTPTKKTRRQLDQDATPRATSSMPIISPPPSSVNLSGGTIPRHHRDMDTMSLGSETNSMSSRQTRSTDDSQASRKRSRSGSPQKTVNRILLDRVVVRSKNVASTGAIPEAVELMAHIENISSGNGYLPTSVSEAFIASLSSVYGFKRSSVHGTPAVIEDCAVPDLSQVSFIVKTSQDRRDILAHEADWNCAVHAPILTLALENTQWSETLKWLNVTTIGIASERRLLQVPVSSRTNGGLLTNTKLDFAIVYNLLAREEDVLVEKGIGCPGPAESMMLRGKPFALCIETKSGSGNQERAFEQISTWNYALRRRLQEIRVTPAAMLVPIPAMSVHGTSWYLTMYEDHDDHQIARGNMLLGDSDTAHGVYQIIAGLRLCFDYCCGTYLPWLRREILGTA